MLPKAPSIPSNLSWVARGGMVHAGFTAVGAVLFVLGLTSHVWRLSEPVGFYDEGFLLTHSELVLRGQIPFRDFYSVYPPGIYYLIAGLWNVTGVSILSFRYLGMVLFVCLCALGGRHAGALRGARFSWVAAGLISIWSVPLSNVPFAWSAALVLTFGGFELLARDAQRSRVPVAGAVAIGLISVVRCELFIYILVLGSITTVLARSDTAPLGTRVRRVALVSGIALAVAALLWLPILAYGGVHRVYGDLFSNLRRLMSARVIPFPDLLALQVAPGSSLSVPVVLARPTELGVVLCFSAPLLAVAYLRRTQSAAASTRVRAGLILALTIAVLPQMSGRPDIGHILHSVPPGLVVAATWVETAIAGGTSAPFALACVSVALLGLGSTRVALMSRSSKPYAAGAGLIGLPRESGIPQPDEGIARARRAVADAVRRHTKRGDPIFIGVNRHDKVFAVELDLYYLLERTGGVRYISFDPNVTTREDTQREMISDLLKHDVRVAVLSSRIDVPDRPGLVPGSNLLDDFLQRRFVEVMRANPYRVLVALRSSPQ